jgi:hypothetical protein
MNDLKSVLMTIIVAIAPFGALAQTQETLSPQVGATYYPESGCALKVVSVDPSDSTLLLKMVSNHWGVEPINGCGIFADYAIKYKKDQREPGLFKLLGPDGKERLRGPFKCGSNGERDCYFAVELQVINPSAFSIDYKNGTVEKYQTH